MLVASTSHLIKCIERIIKEKTLATTSLEMQLILGQAGSLNKTSKAWAVDENAFDRLERKMEMSAEVQQLQTSDRKVHGTQLMSTS